MPSSLRRLCVHSVGPLLLSAACASGRSTGGGALEPRFVAVHNTLNAMGLAQLGPIHEGLIGAGREERVMLPLPPGCFTIVVMAGAGLRDMEATLLDPRGTPMAHDVSGQPEAVLRPCIESADNYVLAMKVAAGTGSWVAEAWSGSSGVGSAMAGSAGSNRSQPEGTCASPLSLAPGVVNGSTTHGEANNSGSCGAGDSSELVYALTTTTRTRASFDVEADFDSVLYIRKDDCTDPNSEIECNDDSSDRQHSHVDTVLEPGKYFVFVDGYGHEGGDFKLTVSLTEAQAMVDRCQRAPHLGDGVMVTAPLSASNDAQATCGGGAQGPDAAWRAEIPARARVRIIEHSDDAVPVVHVRRACADTQSEVACGESGAAAGDASITGLFDAGTYYVFADAHERDATGHYSLLFQTAPPVGVGAIADACANASPLSAGPSGSLDGDTFSAHDDVSGTCGGAGAPDVVYRVDVALRSLFLATLEAEEANHLLVLAGRCGDRSTEIACGRSVREVLAPGTYFLAVDGSSPAAFGRFTLKWALRDVVAQGSACATAPVLDPGRSLTGTTAGAGDRFGTLCGQTDPGAGGPDRVFKLTLAHRAAVRLGLTTTFDAVVAVRTSCAEPLGGPTPELACESESDANHHITLTRTLEAGTYWVVIDGQSSDDHGPFTLDYHMQPLDR
jgi:hypothetical protein